MVAKLAGSAAEQKHKVLIVTSQNSAADSAIDKLAISKCMVVRTHLQGFERRTLLESQVVENPGKTLDKQQLSKPANTSTPPPVNNQGAAKTEDPRIPLTMKPQIWMTS